MTAKLRFWIDEVLEANRRDHTPALVPDPGDQRGPFRSARALAMALMAMQDAHATMTGASLPYRPPAAQPPANGDADCAAAAACLTVLGRLYPAQQVVLAARWHAYAAMHGTCVASRAFGEAIGADYVVHRSGDVAFMAGAEQYRPWGAYDHGPDPLSPGQSFSGVRWGDAPSFLPGMVRQALAIPPGAVAQQGALPVGLPATFAPGPFYFAEYAEVMSKGALHSATRTAEEEETGIFWAYDGPAEIGTPPRLYMQVALAVLDARAPLSATSLIEVLSAAAVAMADAGNQAWHYKYSPIHLLWRPVLGIRNAEPLPGTPRDPNWVPLGKPETNKRIVGTTPDFPAYPSGHATFGAACFEVLRRYIRQREGLNFGNGDVDPIGFRFVSDEYDGRNTDPRDGLPRRRVNRHYPSLWKAIVDNSESRIWLGVHWRMDGISKRGADGNTEHGQPRRPAELGDFGGVILGMRIAEAVATARGFA